MTVRARLNTKIGAKGGQGTAGVSTAFTRALALRAASSRAVRARSSPAAWRGRPPLPLPPSAFHTPARTNQHRRRDLANDVSKRCGTLPCMIGDARCRSGAQRTRTHPNARPSGRAAAFRSGAASSSDRNASITQELRVLAQEVAGLGSAGSERGRTQRTCASSRMGGGSRVKLTQGAWSIEVYRLQGRAESQKHGAQDRPAAGCFGRPAPAAAPCLPRPRHRPLSR